jgi:hypothetical protein
VEKKEKEEKKKSEEKRGIERTNNRADRVRALFLFVVVAKETTK